MVRGSWQKRVEAVEARRQAVKQRKQRLEDKKQYKQWVQEWLHLLERHGDRLPTDQSVRRRLHVWTDCLPTDGPPILDLVEEDKSLKRRSRSGSMENQETAAAAIGGRRNRSNSLTADKSSTPVVTNINGSKRKVHPRARGGSAADQDLEASTAGATVALEWAWLCRSHFFTAKCEEAARGGKKGSSSCRHIHYSPQYKTLCQVLSSGRRKQDLVLSEEAVLQSTPNDMATSHPGAMEMIYYFTLDCLGGDGGSTSTTEEEGGSTNNLHERITEAFAAKGIAMASIVYVAVEDILVFDRYREGITVTDREFVAALIGEDFYRARGSSVGSEQEEADEESALTNLDGPVLEHILTFLPDTSVATACQVCKAWYHEIGRNSPNLWRHLLERRDWPQPVLPLDSTVQPSALDATLHSYRQEFLKHYAAIRDMSAIKTALAAITNKKVVEEKEMSYQDFSTRKHAPSFPNCCVGLQVWSSNRVLAGYANDCSLRLFETVDKGGGKGCRELVCQKIDPYRNTKKRSCRLVSVGLDDDCVGGLCHVMADNVDAEAYILVVMSRDDFLLGESSASKDVGGSDGLEHLNVIDIGEAVLNYLLSSDTVDHRLLQLIDFLEEGGLIGEVEVLVSQTMASCGYGRFLVEVSISVPPLDHREDVDDGDGLLLLDRKLILFSAGIGAIVWMGDSNPLSKPLRPRQEEMTIAYLRRPREGGSRAACTLAIGSKISPSIMVLDIDPTGAVQSSQLLLASEMVRNEVVTSGWNYNPAPHHRPFVVTLTDIVAADTLVKLIDERITERLSVVSFYPRFPAVNEPAYITLTLEGDMEVIRIGALSEEHVVLLCRKFKDDLLHEEDGNNLAGIQGHWFDRSPHDIDVYASVVHVPSRREIGRQRWLDGVTSGMTEIPQISVFSESTIGVALSWKGVVMTGDGVRAVGESAKVIVLDGAMDRSAKKKKKRAGGKAAKKDFFARGMSLRG